MERRDQDELTSASDSDTKYQNRPATAPVVHNKRPKIDKFQFSNPSPRVPFGNVRRGINTPTAYGPTATGSSSQQSTAPQAPVMKDSTPEVEPLQVYCRVKRLESFHGEPCLCVNINNAESITVYPPDSLSWTKAKQGTYSFNRIYGHTAPQKVLFEEVARPLVQDLLDGKSSLLFAYGVTGSGKTYTMCGTQTEAGIIPHALDLLFNSIAEQKATKYSFKPDHMNGFEAQTRTEIKLQQQLMRSTSQRDLRSGTPNGKGDRRAVHYPVTDSESEEEGKSQDVLPIKFISSVFSVFITYTQIYNKNVYDLLDDDTSLDLGKKTIGPQAKITRADAAGNMYVHNVVEVEVGSAEEAMEIFKQGQKKRKFAQTLLNNESSRSHSIFNIRLVQAPLDAKGEEIMNDKNLIHVSQLSLVDLAGSERNTRTQTVGDRLREAGRINTSIMNLHKCLVALRKRQQKGDTEKVTIPYRDDKLTNFLKSYFEGQGRIRMLLCINPRAEDYAENLHVCAFAEQAQEIDVVRQPVRIIEPPERNILNEVPASKIQRLDDNVGLLATTNIANPLPLQRFNTAGEWKDQLVELRKALADKMDGQSHFNSVLLEMRTAFRNQLSVCDFQLNTKKMEYNSLHEKLKEVEGRKAEINGVLNKMKSERANLARDKEDLEKSNDALAQELAQLKDAYHQKELQHYQERASLLTDAQIQLRLDRHKDDRHWLEGEARLLEEYKGRDLTIAAMKELVNQAETGRYRCSVTESWSRSRYVDDSTSTCSSYTESDSGWSAINSPRSQTLAAVQSRSRIPAGSNVMEIQKSDMAVTNNRRTGAHQPPNEGKWLEHNPSPSLVSNTVFQPIMEKKKSVNKLVNVEDLTRKTSKYCLRSDTQTSDGEVETKLYKGDILPTVCGGAQIILNDVEILKQASPSTIFSPSSLSPPSSANRKRSSRHVERDHRDLDRGEGGGDECKGALSREDLAAKCSRGLSNLDIVGQSKRSRQEVNQTEQEQKPGP